MSLQLKEANIIIRSQHPLDNHVVETWIVFNGECHSLSNLLILPADDIFEYISMNEKFCILIGISLKFVPKGPIGNKSALVQVRAWHRTGDKPLPEPMLTQSIDAYMQH